jgi:predicted  nucleic acid-binding Zn-ribbon protein
MTSIFKCHTCRGTFKSLQGLSNHRRACNASHRRARLQTPYTKKNQLITRNDRPVTSPHLSALEYSSNEEICAGSVIADSIMFFDDEITNLDDFEEDSLNRPENEHFEVSISSSTIVRQDNFSSAETDAHEEENETLDSETEISDPKMLLFQSQIILWKLKNQVSNESMEEIILLMKQFHSSISALPKSMKTTFAKLRPFQSPIRILKGEISIDLSNGQSTKVVVASRSILDIVKYALNNSELNKKENLIIGFQKDGDFLDEINSGEWMRDAERQIKAKIPDAFPLPLILYSDGTAVDKFGKRSVKPGVVSLGIFKRSVRQRLSGQFVLNYFPSVPGKTDSSSKDPVFVELKQKLFLSTWNFVLREVEELLRSEKPYIEANLDGFSGTVRLVPIICMFPVDHPEAQDLVSQKTSNRTSRPCRVCTVTCNRLNDLKYGLRCERWQDDPSTTLVKNMLKFLKNTSLSSSSTDAGSRSSKIYFRNSSIMERCREDIQLQSEFSLRSVRLTSVFAANSNLFLNEEGLWGATPPACFTLSFQTA